MKDIDKDIEHLLHIKEELQKVKDFLSKNPNVIIVSQLRYKFWQDNGLLKSDIQYYIAPLELRPYIENFQG